MYAATWSIDVAVAGNYKLILNYSKNNANGTVSGTPGMNVYTANGSANTNLVLTNFSNWESFTSVKYANITLPAGTYNFKLNGLVNDAMNLTCVILILDN